MISRILVPKDAQLSADADTTTQRRRPTTMDERTLVPAMLPVVVLDGKSTIPTNLPLESIAMRVVVPRDVNQEAYGVKEDFSSPLQPTDMDARIAIPIGAAPPLVIEPPKSIHSTEVIEPDIFMTGEVNLNPAPDRYAIGSEQLITRASSVVFHILLAIFIILLPKIFPPHVQTQEEIDLARKQLVYLLPPGAFEPSKPSPRPAPPAVKVDPRILREVAPTLAPAPAPERVVKELPSAPIPKVDTPPVDSQQSLTLPKIDAPKPALKLEVPEAPQPHKGLILPKSSTSRTLEDSIRDATRNPDAGGRSGAISGPMPHSRGTPGGGGSQGSGGTFGNGYQILTPTEGVDFSDYMARVVAAVRNNWYAVMPESAMLGDKGRVALQFRIMKNGSVPAGEPERLIGSGKEPLDRAAISAIRSSNPFEPLPQAFSGPFIELRFYFLYNLPIEAAYQ